MKTKVWAILVAVLFDFGTLGVGRAVMISPQSVIYNSMGDYTSDYSSQKMIDHSGLFTDFTSGVTELAAYLESQDTGHSTAYGSSFISNFTTSGYIDFDLGDKYELTSFLLWNDIDYQGINNFQLFIDDDMSFSNPKLLGNFSASYGDDGTAVPLQLFSLDKAKGRYIRLQIFDIHPGQFAQLAQIAEIAFDGVPAGIDDDSDGVPNDIDNCPAVFNPDQANLDEDAYGNACDPDDDDDGVVDEQDNCQYDYNPDQYDLDRDGIGDACDTDADGDYIIDAVDACLDTIAGEVVNDNGCSVEQACPCDRQWDNHGEYVNCVAKVSKDFVASGLISATDRGYLVSDAAASLCGWTTPKNRRNRRPAHLSHRKGRVHFGRGSAYICKGRKP